MLLAVVTPGNTIDLWIREQELRAELLKTLEPVHHPSYLLAHLPACRLL